VVVGGALNELRGFRDDCAPGPQGCAYDVGIVSSESETEYNKIEYHIRRGRFLACSTTLTSSTSVSPSIVVVLLWSRGLSEELEEMDIESEDDGVRLSPIHMAMHPPDLRRFKEPPGTVGARDGRNHSSTTSCGIGALVALGAYQRT